ncbi:OmpL47-type beta-barrel domain-containing protein [Solirubrobacter soli]|uniref:OmpL47-type beta-barrel domain-containing protein n=1 Tax=Solirubrobacter soli TaxID=363832 RepID=UPI0003FB3376|nr:hypothetical protein [Solirubrobacter soli]
MAGALIIAGLAGPAAGRAAAAEKVTPDVTGLQRVLVVGCRFHDTTSPDILDYSNNGIRQVLSRTHDYFDTQSNHRVDFEGEFIGWRTLPKSVDDYGSDGSGATKDCQDIALGVLADRGEQATAYSDVVLLFNYDKGISNQTGPMNGRPGTWTRLRYTGGTGGGWTSEALWAHEMGHAFGLLHSTFPTRADGNQYNDFQDAMSGFAHSSQERWNFLAGGVCNGIAGHPRCIYKGEADQIPVDYSAFQKQRLGWLFPDQIATHWGGRSTYRLSAPTYNPGDGPTIEKLKLIEAKIPGSKAYYAIEYRRGDAGGDANAAAFRRGWDSYDVGIRSDRVTVYLVEPDLYAANAGDLGDANLAAVLNPGDRYSSPDGRLTVSFDGIVNTFDTSHMNASVTIATPQPPAPLTYLSADGADGVWLNHDASAQLFAYAAEQGAPVAATYYGVDDPGCTVQTRDCAVYPAEGFTVTGDGVHDVTYFSTDAAGGSEIARHTTIRIDKTPPTTTAGVAAADGGPRVLTLTATDALSGVRQTDYDLDGAGFKPYRDPLQIAAPGTHTIRFRSRDNAGNSEAVRQVEIEDTTATPTTTSPEALSTTPTEAPATTPTPAPTAAPTEVPAAPGAASPATSPAPRSPLAATVTATPARIRTANGRSVKVHVTLHTQVAGATVRLTKIVHTGKGRASGWRVGTADVDGRISAVRGSTYSLTYAVRDRLGRTVSATARIVVRR